MAKDPTSYFIHTVLDVPNAGHWDYLNTFPRAGFVHMDQPTPNEAKAVKLHGLLGNFNISHFESNNKTIDIWLRCNSRNWRKGVSVLKQSIVATFGIEPKIDVSYANSATNNRLRRKSHIHVEYGLSPDNPAIDALWEQELENINK